MLGLKITRATVARITADALMVNVAVASALLLRFFVPLAVRGPNAAFDYAMFSRYIAAYQHSAWLLTLVCIVVFALSGFYTYGRVYQGRYKALVIVQAVTQGYLITGFLTYFFWDRFQLVAIPRAALAAAWLMTLAVVLASRMWILVWERVIRPEREKHLRANGSRAQQLLVIGGAGYIGSALLPKLLQDGRRVRVLDLFLYGPEPVRNVANHPRLELIRGDFRHVQTVVEATRGVDAIVHLGAIVGDPACNLDEQVTVDVNLSATQMIAQVAKASGIRRFVFASTCSVYGASDEILDERSRVKPISLYGRTKLLAEQGLQRMADESFTPTILRFGTIYGLSGRTRFDLVVNLLAAKAKLDGCITVHGGGQWRPFVHVDDAAAAIQSVVRAPLSLVGNEVFNVGCDEQNYTIGQVGELVRQLAFPTELTIEESNTDARNYRVSFRKIRERLAFYPRWTVEEGVGQVIEAVAAGEVQDYREARYSNVKFLGEAGAMEIVRADDDWARQLRSPRPSPQCAATA